MLVFLFWQIWTLGVCGNKYAMPQLLFCGTHCTVTRVFLYQSYLLKVEARTTGDPKAKGWVAFVCNRVIIVAQFWQPVASILKVHLKPHYLSICIFWHVCSGDMFIYFDTVTSTLTQSTSCILWHQICLLMY